MGCSRSKQYKCQPSFAAIGKLYNHLFENRQEGDYVDFVSFDKDTVEPWIPQVIDFINAITQLIEEASQKGEGEELP